MTAPTTNEISRKVKLILNQSDPDTMYLALRPLTSSSPSPRPIDGRTARIQARKGAEESPRYKLVNQQVDMLKRLHGTLPESEQGLLIVALKKNVNAENAPIVAHALAELGDLSVLDHLTSFDDTSLALLTALSEKLAVEHWTFTSNDIDRVQQAVDMLRFEAQLADINADNNEEARRAVRRRDGIIEHFDLTLARVRYLRLAHELQQLHSPALDIDRRELLSRLSAVGFRPDLTTALNELDRKSAVAATQFDYKAAMELLRTFFEEFLEDAARLLEKTSGTTVPKGDKLSHFRTYKDYLRKIGFLGREEEELLQMLYNYISNLGSHVLGSAPEQFHVARVTVIEWCMMLAGRVQAKLKP